MKYTNPIIMSDYSDPDVIRVKDNFYMIASSFNHTPGVPILKSKNLVDWKLIGYVFNELPFSRFSDVVHGAGAWAPALRYHNGKYYALIPFPDEGIYISETDDIEKGTWSKPWCLIEGKGFEDPCCIWDNDKCYLVLAFVKSRIGFNSVLGMYEVTPDLKKTISSTYTIVFDGHNTAPTIEGPKLYKHNDYFYILAPAGSVKTGWQVALRSKNIYGPYEEKIILMQNDSPINGPHQGALIDINKNDYAFIHFQDKDVYGRIIHLEPVEWINDWPICGKINDELLAGTPVASHDYLINKKSNYKIIASDDFKADKLSLMWQTPANKESGWYELNDSLKLNCCYHNDNAFKALNLTPNLFLTKIIYPSFTVSTRVSINLVNDGDEVGLTFMGEQYNYICVERINGVNHLRIKGGAFNQEEDVVIFDSIYNDDVIEFNMKYTEPNTYRLGFNNDYLKNKFTAYKGKWIGGKYGIYAKGKKLGGYGRFMYFKVRRNK